MVEIWKDIKDYEGLYQISDRGNVKSLNYNKTGKEKLLKKGKDDDGYLYVVLYFHGERKHHKIHRLMCKCFLENIENKEQVNHKNGIKSDNAIENLEWCTHTENQRHAWNTGLKKALTGEKHPLYNKHGIDHTSSKEIDRYTKDNVYIDTFINAKIASQILNINYSCISMCCNGKRNTAGGFIWKYKQL